MDAEPNFDVEIEDEPFTRQLNALVLVNVHRARRRAKDDVRQEKQIVTDFQKVIEGIWGEALDLYLATLVRARDFGDQFNRRHRLEAAEANDLVFEALVRLHARACRAALEAYVLLSAGHAAGARLHCRTLYELACIATVICEYGRQPEHADLAERFLLHAHREGHDDMLNFQQHSQSLGLTAFTELEVSDSRVALEDLVARFGKVFLKSYGWAAGLPGWKSNTFTFIAELAGLDHRLPYWRRASHESHATSRGAQLNVMETRNGPVLLVGPSSSDLAEPASDSLISLYQCTVSLMSAGGPRTELDDLIEIETICALLDRANEALTAADRALQRDILVARRRAGSVRRVVS